MTTIEKYLFTPLYDPRDLGDVVRWWEARRPLYNLVVGTAGMVTLGTVAVLHPGPPPVFASLVLAWGLMANLCFSGGAVADLILRRWIGEDGHVVGPVLFRCGTAFSIGLTLLPVPLAIMGWLLRRLG